MGINQNLMFVCLFVFRVRNNLKTTLRESIFSLSEASYREMGVETGYKSATEQSDQIANHKHDNRTCFPF